MIPFPLPGHPPVAPPAPDAAQRAAALDVENSWIVEAPAGSGKTGLLIQRYLSLLAGAGDPAEVLALTFTQKATAEMRDRVLRALRMGRQPCPEAASDFDRLTHTLAARALQRDAEQGWHLLSRPHRLNIRTIDSLCSDIARRVPFMEGGVGTASPVSDATSLYREAARAVMLRLGGDDAELSRAIETVLLHRDGDLIFCEKVLAEMLGTRDQWGKLVPLQAGALEDSELDATALPRLNESMRRALCAGLSELHQCFSAAELDQVADVARRLAFVEGYQGKPSAFAGCVQGAGGLGAEAHHHDQWLLVAQLLLTQGGTWRKSFPINLVGARVDKDLAAELRALIHGIGSEEVAALLHAIRELPPTEFPPEQWVVTKALLRLLRHAFIELQLLFARRGVCDFTAVALAARAALRADADLQATLGTRLRHLLVDEMQDTSSSQYELLESLTAGWDGQGQTVFLVGDPKQSIYLFRQARVELFQHCMRTGRLGDIRVGVLQLSANFRSGRKLVRQFNDTFVQVFPSSEVSEGDVAYSPADGVLPSKPDEGIAWHLRLLLPRLEDAAANQRLRQEAVRSEAAEMVALVRQALAGGRSRRVAVLARARTHVTEIAHALRQQGIPFRAVEMETLDERQEVLDVLAITRALLHPADRTAWLAILHAPWCGAGLADLHRLAAGDDASRGKEALRTHLRERLARLSGGSQHRVRQTLDVMNAALSHTGAETLANRVERTWRSLGGDRCTDSVGRENVRLFLRVLDSMEAENEAVNRFSLARRLKRLFAEPQTADAAVEIMTIHKAKGLEWDVVLVPGLHRVSAQDKLPALDWLEMSGEAADGTRDVLLAPLPGKGGDAGKLLTFIRSKRRQRANAELKRVLYVAATRARTALHLFASPQSTRDGVPVNDKSTLLKAASRAAHFTPAEAQPEQSLEQGEAEPLALAAAAGTNAAPRRTPPMLARLPDNYHPLQHLRESAPEAHVRASPAVEPLFERPEGTFGARAVGSTIHAFVERLTKEFAGRVSAGQAAEQAAESLLGTLDGWTRAIHAVLRSGGIPPDAAARASDTVLRALRRTLESADGRWLLLPHSGAASEAAWRSVGEEGVSRVRLDRSFFACDSPGTAGEGTLWIVDFKTADRAPAAQEAFLIGERERYSGQLESYARLRLQSLQTNTPVMLGLFYPLMGRLVWWPFVPANAEPVETAEHVADTAPRQLSMFG